MISLFNLKEKLESMGCEFEDLQPIDLSVGISTNEYWFTYEDRLFYTEDLYDTIEEQLKFSTEHSVCCTIELVDDWRLCPRCKEHC